MNKISFLKSIKKRKNNVLHMPYTKLPGIYHTSRDQQSSPTHALDSNCGCLSGKTIVTYQALANGALSMERREGRKEGEMKRGR